MIGRAGVRSRRRPGTRDPSARLAPLAAVALGLAAIAGCSDGGPSASGPPVAPPGTLEREAAQLMAGSSTTIPTRIRDGDLTDVDELALAMSGSTSGDGAWIGIFSRLRARSWLATRYPGRYDLETLYSGEVVATARANESEHVALGVYIDEPLPALISVVESRALGDLIELDVTLDAGPATVRSIHDDTARGVLPGGVRRGLFVVGREGSTGDWRIHSVMELQVAAVAPGQEPDQ